MTERAFRVINGDGELDESSAVLPKDYALILEENRRLLRVVAGYKAQIAKLMREDPQAEYVEAVLAYWKRVCHGPDSRVLIPMDGKRADAVRKALKWIIDSDEDPLLASPKKDEHREALEAATERATERIRAAIDGAARFPYEGRYGMRFAEAGDGLQKKVDIRYILRDEAKIDQFQALFEADDKRRAYAHELHARLKAQPQLRLVLASLNPEMGEILARAIRWCQSQ
jgi:hypothetical protein